MSLSAPTIIGLVVLVVAVIGVAAYLSHLAEKKRREGLAAVARGLGLRFSADRRRNHARRFDHFEIFTRGKDRYAHNTLEGELELGPWSCAVRAGDYHYITESTDSDGRTSTTTHRFSYFLVHLPFDDTPTLTIRREGVFDKLAASFGFDDIDFESAEFSRKFHVKSSDKRFAYDVIHPRMMELLLKANPPRLEIAHAQCCTGDGKKRWEPAHFQYQARLLNRICELWPEHVARDLEDRG